MHGPRVCGINKQVAHILDEMCDLEDSAFRPFIFRLPAPVADLKGKIVPGCNIYIQWQ